VDKAYTITVTITDDGDGTPASAGTVSGGSDTFGVFGNHTYSEEGTYMTTPSVHDQDGTNTTSNSTSKAGNAAPSGVGGTGSLSLSPAPGQAPPTVTNPGAQTTAKGAAVSLQSQASSPSGYTLTYDADGLPLGLAINNSTGLISGTVDHAAAEACGGSYKVNLRVDDGHGGSATQTFTWTVTDTPRAPGLTKAGNPSSAQGDVVSPQLSASDANPLTYDAAGLPTGLSIDPGSDLISGAVGLAAAGSSPSTVTGTPSDGTGSASQTFNGTVAHIKLANRGDRSSREGSAVSLPVSAGDADHDLLSCGASGLAPGLSINGAARTPHNLPALPDD